MLDLSARKVYGALAEQCVGGDAKADKVENATSGNLAGLDSNGNLTDSGVSPTEDVTVEGNPVSFDSPFEQDAKSVVVSVKPIQDLHGLPFPYVGGAYKNKLPLVLADIKANNTSGTWSGNSYTLNGITFDFDVDNGGNITSIDVSGTSTAYTDLLLADGTNRHTLDYYGFVVGTTYTMTGGGTNIIVMFNGQESNIEVTTGSTDFTVDATSTYYPCIRITNSKTVDSIIYPMVRLATESDATFAPYSNICPISGIDEVEIEVSDGESEPTTTTIPLPSTLYGGDVDVTDGDGTNNGGFAVFDGSEDENWAEGLVEGAYSLPKSVITNAYIPRNSHDFGTDKFEVADQNTFVLGTIWAGGDYLNVIIKNMFPTLTEFKTFLASNPLQVKYPLNVPTTISFDPTDVELLEGMNVVSTNGEKVAVTYGRSLWQDIDELKTDTEGKLDKSDVADIEGDTASKAYAVNDFMLRADGLYKVTAPIANGASITASNTTKTTIGAVLTALLNS